MTELIVRNCCLCGAKFNDAIRMRMGELIVCPRCAVDLPSPGLTPPRPAGCPSCAQAEAEVDRLKAAMDLEARARKEAADGLADAKAERDELLDLLERCISRDGSFIPDEDVAAVRAALARFRPSDDPSIPAGDLEDALEDDPEPHRGFHEGHDTFEEAEGLR